MPFALSISLPPNGDDVDLVRDNLAAYNQSQTRPGAEAKSVAIIARDDAGEAIGGAVANINWGWLYIELLWVVEAQRGQGVGTALMDQAIDIGVTRAHTTTTSFQARPFYEQRGYKVFGALADKPPGHALYFLKKEGLIRR